MSHEMGYSIELGYFFSLSLLEMTFWNEEGDLLEITLRDTVPQRTHDELASSTVVIRGSISPMHLH